MPSFIIPETTNILAADLNPFILTIFAVIFILALYIFIKTKWSARQYY